VKVSARNKAIGVTIKLNEEEATRLYEILNHSHHLNYKEANVDGDACEEFSRDLWYQLDEQGYRCDYV